MGKITLKITDKVERTQNKNGTPYLKTKGTLIKKNGDRLENRTIMAFGKAYEGTTSFIKQNRTVTVEGGFDGGVVMIYGPDADKVAPSEEAEAA